MDSLASHLFSSKFHSAQIESYDDTKVSESNIISNSIFSIEMIDAIEFAGLQKNYN